MEEKPKKTALTDKNEAFCIEWLKSFNATEAYRIIYKCSPESANANGPRLLLNDSIQKRLAELRDEFFSDLKLEAKKILQEAARIAFSDVGQAFDDRECLKKISEIPEDVRRAISSLEIDELWSGKGEDREQIGVTKKIKFWSKDKNIEYLMKHLGLFAENNRQIGNAVAEALKPPVIK